MKLCLLTTALIISCLVPNAFGQQAKLEGHFFDDKYSPSSGVRIIVPGGQAATTDSNGHFSISFPASIQPGQATRIEVVKSNWVIYQPMFGYCVTQSMEKNFEPLRVVIVPKGSPLALSPKRLSQVIARWTAERVKLQREVGNLKQDLDESAFLRQYAKEYGFTLEQFRDAAEQWAKIKDSDDKEERALKEYWQKNYGRAAQLAQESAQVADEELNQANKKTVEASLKVIRRYELAGNSYYAQDKFREALRAYNEVEKRFETREISKETFTAEWAEVRFLIGNAKEALGIRVEGEEGPRLLKEALAEYQQSAMVYTPEQSPRRWAATQVRFGRALVNLGVRVSGAESAEYLNEAVAAYRAALEIRTREKLPAEWAETQNSLGNVFHSLGVRVSGAESLRYLNEAVAAYRATLEVSTREHFPLQWAAAKANLCNAQRSLGERISGVESIKSLNEAGVACRAALEVHTREGLPQDWALTQLNLGNVLQSLGRRLSGAEQMKYLNEAIADYRAGLEVTTREQSPQDWSSMQNSLGTALRNLGDRTVGTESLKYLNDAVAAYRAALEVSTREQLPQDWAATQTNLGHALLTLSDRVGRAASINYINYLDQAVVAYRAALEVSTREHFPQQWVAGQNNLGNGLRSLGERQSGGEGTKHLNEAVAAYRAALGVTSRKELPQEWAGTQVNLGNVLWSLGERVSGKESVNYLNEAVAAYRAALEESTREYFPQQWATFQYNLGVGLESLGTRVSGTASIQYLNEAVAAYRAALEIRTREHLPHQWVGTQFNLGNVLLNLSERLDGAESIKCLNQAIGAFRAGLELSIQEQSPREWAGMQNNLGRALASLGERVGGIESVKYFDDAVVAYRAALEVRVREDLPEQAVTQNNLGRVYFQLHKWPDAAAAYAKVLTLDPDNEEAYGRAAWLYHDALFEFNKAFVVNQEWLALHPEDISAEANFAEAHCSIGRFAECGQRINGLLNMAEVPVSSKTALRAIVIASLLADNKASQVPAKIHALIAEVTRQPAEFKVVWAFDGTRHFIDQTEKLSADRAWLGQLFDALASKDRDTILKALQDVRANFKEKR